MGKNKTLSTFLESPVQGEGGFPEAVALELGLKNQWVLITT